MCRGDMMKRCELCKGKARIFCESDQARLCWSCDARVHSANFLVARHSRNLLCHVCRSATPWSASGAKLRPTFAVCERCIIGGRRGADEDEAEADGEVEEVVDENQVNPWSPPVAESSSGEDDAASGGRKAIVSRKRCRIEVTSSDEDLSCSSCQPSFPTAFPSKNQKTNSDPVDGDGSGILNQRRRLHEETNTSEAEYSNSTFPKPSI